MAGPEVYMGSYIVHADGDRLTTVDLVNQRVSSIGIRPARTWFGRLLSLTAAVAEAKGASQGGYKSAVLSPDGAKLYVLGRSMASSFDEQGQVTAVEERSLGLQVLELDTGLQVMALPTEADRLRFSADSASLLLVGWMTGRTDVLEPESLTPVDSRAAWLITP